MPKKYIERFVEIKENEIRQFMTDLIEFKKGIQNNYPTAKNFRVEIGSVEHYSEFHDNYSYDPYIKLVYDREETDEEYNDRIKREKLYKKYLE